MQRTREMQGKALRDVVFDDEVSIGETNDHELLDVLENLVPRAYKGLVRRKGASSKPGKGL